MTEASAARRRAYQRYRERQKQQKEDDKRTIEAMDRQIQTLQAERAELAHRIEMLQKVTLADGSDDKMLSVFCHPLA